MKSLNFKRGTFITYKTQPAVFAIFGGNMYLPEKKGEPYDRSLLCYYDPYYIETDEFGNENIVPIFDCEIDGVECQWTISDEDDGWRECTESEINAAIKLLFDIKKLAWDDTTKSLRHVRQNESLSFEKKTTTKSKTRPLITLAVNSDWVQKDAIRTVTVECAKLLMEECENLKNAFSVYGSSYQSGYCREMSPYYNDGIRDAWGNWYDDYD